MVFRFSTRFLPWKPGFSEGKNPVSKAETGLVAPPGEVNHNARANAIKNTVNPSTIASA